MFFSSPFHAQSTYFPPISETAAWEEVTPASMGWFEDKIPSLYSFLEAENTKGFIVLKDGKIALEKYFGSFTKDSLWYWASAGKTITSFLVGQAQQAGQLSITDATSKYLGQGWTSCTPALESRIQIVHQLTMTSGLEDGIADNHCTIDTCLIFKSDPATRWAYHNAPYTLLEKVLEKASGQNINVYTQQKLKSMIGMTGAWFTLDYDNVYFSKVRSMARFGLLIQNKGVWNNKVLLADTAYVKQMINTSQDINPSYGYLWWLNGKPKYMLPTTQFIFPGSLAPDAPDDMIAALGKNGQMINIAPELGLVVIRMGEKPTSQAAEIGIVFCNQMWQKLNDIMCGVSAVENSDPTEQSLILYPNPANDRIIVPETDIFTLYTIYSITGKEVKQGMLPADQSIDIASLPSGWYMVKFSNAHSSKGIVRFLKQ